MAEPTNGSPSPLAFWKRPLSQEVRLILAFVLMGAVLLLTPLFYKSQKPAESASKGQPAKTTAKTPVTSTAATSTPASNSAKPATPAAQQKTAPASSTPPPAAEIKKASAEQLYTVDTPLYKVTFSNKGGVVRSWLLKQYKDHEGKPVDLVNPLAQSKTPSPMALVFSGEKPPVDPNYQLFLVTQSNNGLSLRFTYSDGQITVDKSFDFRKNEYVLGVSSAVTMAGKGVPHRLAWRGGFGDRFVGGAAAKIKVVYFDTANDKVKSNEAKAAADGPISERGMFTFAGLEDTYFASVFLPVGDNELDVQTWRDVLKSTPESKDEPHVGVAVGGHPTNTMRLFVGPKDLDILKSINPKLGGLVDWGWFAIIAQPLFLSLKWMNDTMVHSWGWSIVVVTIIINFLTLPLKFSSMRSMKKMQELAPAIKALNDKYKGVGLRDPKKAQQNEEMMALYKKNGVNPMGGCLPMALQMPFFFAFYKVLAVAIELRGAEWLWVRDLSQAEQLPIHILPIIMVITQVAMSKITPTSPAADPSQQRMMTLMMPVMMGIFLYSAQSGLVLYWLTGNIVAILQQVMFNRLSPPIPIVTNTTPAVSKSKKART